MSFPGNIGDLMAQFQQVQEGMQRARDELKQKTVQASAGGGMVSVTMNGNHEITEVRIEKEVVNPDDVDMLQDLLKAAVNEASRKSQELLKSEISKLTGGISIPGFN